MPSRAEMRLLLEHVLRGIVIAVLALMLWQSLRQETVSGGEVVRARGIGAELADWSALAKASGEIHLQLDSVPWPLERAWVGALAGAGSNVTWSGDLPPVMIDAQPVASPTGGTRVFVAAPSGSSVVVSDEVGAIDTVRAQTAGATLALASTAGQLTACVKGSAASAVQRDPLSLHRVLVIGNAGWESKFVAAALEEDGWKVDAFVRVAPGVEVTQGSGAAIDTSRYSAVVALDGAAARFANRIGEFARRGGGVVLGQQAASLDAMLPLRAGAVGPATSEAHAAQASESLSLATFPLAPITSLRGDAIPLDRRGGAVATAARRIGAGRALQFGYEGTWRWRMSGSGGAVRDHRQWWTAMVSSVAHAPRVPRITAASSTDQAPMIGLVTDIGPSIPGVDRSSTFSGNASEWMAWLLILVVLGLIGEVTSRRLRGTP